MVPLALEDASMKKYYLCVLVLVCLVTQGQGACVPTFTEDGETDVGGCTVLSVGQYAWPDTFHKYVEYHVTWPDGQVDDFVVDDSGQCVLDVSTSCCTGMSAQACWPP